MLSAISCKEFNFLQEGYSKVSLLLASEKYYEAESLMRGLLEKVTLLKPVTGDRADLLYYRKIQAECYTNLASCLYNKGEYEEHFEEVRMMLSKALKSDHLNYWAYFNLASIYYKENEYRQALQNLNCSLSCLYLIKAVLSKDIENRNRQIDLARSISYSQNNTRARYVRLLMQIKQNRIRFALNEVDLIMQVQSKPELDELKKSLLRVINSSPGIQAKDHRELIKLAIALISSAQNQQSRLISNIKNDMEVNAIIKEIDDKVYEFNDLFRQVNQLGSSQNVFNFKVMHMVSRFDKRTHIVSNKVLQSIKQEKKMSQSHNLKAHSIQLEAKVIERMNQSKKSLNESKNAYGQSLFQISKSQNMQNSNKMIIGNLLSSINNNTRNFRVLSNDDMEQTQLEVDVEGNMRKKLGIDVIQSQIRPINENDEILLSGSQVKPSDNHFVNEDDDLLLDSHFDREFQKEKNSLIKQNTPQLFNQNNPLKSSSRTEEVSIHLYPLSEPYKVLQLILIKAEFRDEIKDKLLGIYSQLEYNSGFIETYKFRSRQVNQNNHQNSVDWGQSLGFIKIAEEAKNILIKTYKSEPYYYNDKLLGQGEIEVTTAGVIKVPLYLKMRNIGTVSIKLVVSEQNLSSSFKKSVTSNFSSSLKSQSQTSQPG